MSRQRLWINTENSFKPHLVWSQINMLQRSLENQEAAAREEQNKLVSLKKKQKQPKRNTARDFPFTPQHMLSRACSQRNAMVWFVFCFVFTCRMSKMSCRCVLTAVLGVIMLTFREQNNNVKQTLTYRDTRSNLAFIYVSGRGGEKKSIIWKCCFGKSYVLTVPHTDPYSKMPAEVT